MITQKQIMKNEMKLPITQKKNSEKSNLCDYNDAYIWVKGDITVTASLQIQVAFKNSAPFT